MTAAAFLYMVLSARGQGEPMPPLPAETPPPSAQPAPEPATPFTPRDRQPISPALLQGNLLKNPSFEDGRDPWTAMVRPEQPRWADFSLSNILSHSGQWSALLNLRTDGYDLGTRVYGVMQELEVHELPERISGWYYVERWQRGAQMQYLQAAVVVIAEDPKAFSNHPAAVRAKSLQLAYVLAGINQPPFDISNRKFLFRGPDEPLVGRWVPFDFPLKRDFQRAWELLPTGFDKIRVFFEARFDERRPTDPQGVADVCYDDLYLGPSEQR